LGRGGRRSQAGRRLSLTRLPQPVVGGTGADRAGRATVNRHGHRRADYANHHDELQYERYQVFYALVIKAAIILFVVYLQRTKSH
jgi:hypothetical protein